jgi:hypothetical protein
MGFAFAEAGVSDRLNRQAFEDVSSSSASNQRTGFDISLRLKNNFAWQLLRTHSMANPVSYVPGDVAS